MRKFQNGFLIISCMIITIFCICLTKANDEIAIQANASGLSNKSIGWGLKREKDHKQPDLGSENKQLIEKYKGLAMGKENSKQVYLTFDQGYEAGYTEKILEVLKNNNVKACFFITAHYLNSATELVEKMVKEGHTIR